MNIIILRNTNCYKHILKKVISSKKGDTFKLITNNIVAIRKFKENKMNAIMLAGGPKLVEGNLLPNSNYKILQIIYQKYTYYIVLKEIINDN